MKNMNSLQKVTGLSADQASRKVNGGVRQNSNPSRSVVVKKDEIALNFDAPTSFEIVVKYISGVIAKNREEVENALIATGSPVSIRNANMKRLNAEVQNRLIQKNQNGDAFRLYMTALIGAMYGRSLDSTGFFTSNEARAYSTGDVGELNSAVDNTISMLPTKPLTTIEPTKTGNILPYQKTNDGGIEKTKTDQDWGSILSGSAQVINALGGVVGLFTGGQPASEGNSAFDQYNDNGANGAQDGKKNNKWIWVVLGLVLVGIAIAVVVKMTKKSN